MVSFSSYVMAVNRVEERLRKVTKALDAAGVPYAVIGGNAVAAWVATADPHATRATKDVDVLVRLEHRDRIAAAMASLGFVEHDLRRILMYIDPAEPSRRSGVHFVWADTLIKPSYAAPSPSVEESIRGSEGFLVLTLPALLRMKLTSFRDIDRVHVRDLIKVGLVNASVRATLSAPLQTRLAEIESSEVDGDHWDE